MYLRSVVRYMSAAFSTFEMFPWPAPSFSANSACVRPIAFRISARGIESSVSLTFASTRACAPGLMRRFRFSHFSAIDEPFPTKFAQVFLVQPVGQRDKGLVEPVVAALAPADQQDGTPARVKGKERAKRLPFVLGSQLLHVGESRPLHRVHARPPQSGSDRGEHV